MKKHNRERGRGEREKQKSKNCAALFLLSFQSPKHN